MQDKNDANRMRKELLIRIIKDFMNDTLSEKIDKIPIEIRPKGEASSRCCIYKDRAVLKYRLMAMLGISVEDETDESKPLSAYLADALNRGPFDEKILSVLDVACTSCVTSRYLVTNACRGCFARPCVFNCPRGAMSVVDGKSIIDYSKCIDCGICTQVCPYHAVIRVPIPCEEACPVGAIKRNHETDVQEIDFGKCTYCGKCMVACPFSAILEKSQIIDVLKAIKEKKKITAMLAPSVVGQFPVPLERIAGAVLAIGFTGVEEVAFGADMTSENEAEEFVERMKRGDKLMTTSCCPSYVETVKKHVPGLSAAVSETPSPMRYTSRTLKKEDPETLTVFIGPCVAKRKEALIDVNTDFVLTFEELAAMFVAFDLQFESVKPHEMTRPVKSSGRGYATSCGVSSAVLKEMKDAGREDIPDINAQFINGIDKKAVKMLQMYATGKMPGNFLEVMACEGGCVGGPCAIGKVKLAIDAVKKYADGPGIPKKEK